MCSVLYKFGKKLQFCKVRLFVTWIEWKQEVDLGKVVRGNWWCCRFFLWVGYAVLMAPVLRYVVFCSVYFSLSFHMIWRVNHELKEHGMCPV